MALACPSLNFSFKCFSCSSALRGCFNFGGCFKSSDGRKLSEVESESPSDSRHEDDNSTTSLTPTLLVPGSFFPSTPKLEDNNSGSIWINSVSVSLPQNDDLSNDPYKNISQNLTTYNAPVRINGESNGQCIEIQSIFNNPVKNSGDEEMDELAKSHMDEFSKLMSLGETNASYETKLPTPMRQVDELASNGDSKYEDIEEEVLGRDLESSQYTSVPKVLSVRIILQERENLGIFLPVGGLYSSTEDSDPASPRPPLSELSSLGQQPLPQLGEETRIPQFNSLPGEEKRVVRIRVAPVDARTKGDEIKRPDGLCGYEEINDKELECWEKIGISLAQSQPKPQPQPQSNDLLQSPRVFEQFFENIVTQTNPSAFFETLNQYVNSFTGGIEGIFPSTAPASARAEPNNGNGKGKQ
jgi:hypothetical protein